MSTWRVSRETIEVLAHPNADRLELGNVGGFQVVMQKGLRQTGQTVIVIPHNSLLPDSPLFEGFKPYLAGPDKNRVRAQNMRGELSQAIVIEDQPQFSEIPLGQDISESLGITQYVPVIPPQLAGKVKPMGHIETGGSEITRHDVEQFNLYVSEFQEGEEVIVTEKIHGSSNIMIRTKDGNRLVSSKGLLGRMLTIEESDTNTYWQSAKNCGIFELLDKYYPNLHVQAFGEVVPVQKNYSYHFTEPTVFLFRVDIEGQTVPFDEVPQELKDKWVPVLYRGPFDIEKIRKMREGMETLSGKSTVVREGVVVSPKQPRKAIKGNFPLYLKVINPAYKDDADAVN